MRIFFRLLYKGLKDLGRNKWEQILTFAAVALVTFLGALFLLVIHNIRHQVLESKGQIRFELFWNSTVERDSYEQQWSKIQQFPSLISIKTFSPEEAINLVAENLGGDLNLDWLQANNPLPPTAVLTFSLSDPEAQNQAKELYRRLKGLPGVEKVHYNPLQADIAGSWTEFCRRVMWPFIFFLILLVGLIVGNTFKLSQLSQKEEIDVLRLVGAGRWYIQLPLLTGAAAQALCGGAVALLLLKLVHSNLRAILYSPPLWLDIEFLSLSEITILMAVLVCVSLLSSWVAIRR